MDEADWNASRDPERMVGFLLGQDPGAWEQVLGWFRGKGWKQDLAVPPSARKLRLFACACCRPLFDILIDPRSQQAIETAERFADGQASPEDLENARVELAEAVDMLEPSTMERYPSAFGLGVAARQLWSRAAKAAAQVTLVSAARAAQAVQEAVEKASIEWAAHGHDIAQIARETGAIARADLLRDLFGPQPFHAVIIHPAWCSSPVLRLAEAIYEERALPSGHLDTARMNILADALEEAGCINADLLTHCRSPGPHTLGCWVVDLVLGKQ